MTLSKSSTAVMDVTRFGCSYWWACVYATVAATLAFWPNLRLPAGFYVPAFQFGVFVLSAATRQLREARSGRDPNVIWGSLFAVRLAAATLLGVALRLALAWWISV